MANQITINESTSDASEPRDEVTSAATRQCGRCRRHFPVDVAANSMELLDWWACPDCSDALMPGRRPSPTSSTP